MLLLLGFCWWLGDLQLNRLWLWIAFLLPIWLLVVFVNRRLRRQATVPLTISHDSYIMYGDKLLSARVEFNSVQLVIYEYSNSNNSKMYNVILVPAKGEPLALPQPYFGDLDFNAAVLLANDVAKLLQIPFERTLMPPE